MKDTEFHSADEPGCEWRVGGFATGVRRFYLLTVRRFVLLPVLCVVIMVIDELRAMKTLREKQVRAMSRAGFFCSEALLPFVKPDFRCLHRQSLRLSVPPVVWQTHYQTMKLIIEPVELVCCAQPFLLICCNSQLLYSRIFPYSGTCQAHWM